MKLKIGCDFIFIKRFEEAFASKGEDFLHKIFLVDELKSATTIQSLAGYFALKESVFKALGFNAGDWHFVKIFKHANGKPDIEVFHDISKKILTYDVSISHDNGYAIAVACFLLKDSEYDIN